MDIAPYVEGLNFIRQNNEEKRLEFKRHDALALPENAEGFDFVVSHGLTYCLTDFEISELFRRVMKVLKPEGVFLLSDAAFLNFRIFAGRVVRRVMSRPVNLAPAGFVSVKYKQTGWYRSPGSVRRLLTATNNAVLVENINCPKDIHNPCTRMFKLQKKSTL
jgi:SAM-dependent methyltransferase